MHDSKFLVHAIGCMYDARMDVCMNMLLVFKSVGGIYASNADPKKIGD